MSLSEAQNLLVELETNEGISGWGGGFALPLDLDSFVEHAEDPILGGVEIKHGILTVPDTPGIGARPDPAWRGKLKEVR
jgi:L-alanine-DL-glutamate epimerase-like enolase superfamily enzyme